MWTTVALVALLLVFDGIQAISYSEVLDEEWNTFKLEFSKSYDNENEEQVRRQIFEDNKRKMDKHNRRFSLGLETYEMGVNQFSDLLPKEFESLMLNDLSSSQFSENVDFIFTRQENYFIPDSIDWRTKGAVTPVRDQGRCGSCWAFAAVASLEGQQFKQNHKLIELSEQNLLDCSSVSPYKNLGCDGGNALEALIYVMDNKGIDIYSSYPYEAVASQCRFRRDKVGATVRAVGGVKPGDESALALAVATIGPIAVHLNSTGFKDYSGGVLNIECSGDKINHAATIVGYGHDQKGGDYWLVKNSWGSTWGDEGYIRMSRNRQNQCGIANAAVFPLV